MLLAATLGYLVITYPLFLLITQGTTALVMLALATFALLFGLFGGAIRPRWRRCFRPACATARWRWATTR